MRKRKRKRMCTIAIACCSMICFVYLSGVFFFHGRFLPGTFVNGTSVMFRSPEELTLDMKSETGRHRVEFVKSDGQVESLTFQELGIVSMNDNQLLSEPTGSSWTWPVAMFQRKEYDIIDKLMMDTKDMKQQLNHVDWISGEVPQSKMPYRVVPDETGFRLVRTQGERYVDTTKLADVIAEHIGNHSFRIDLEKEGCYKALETISVMEPVRVKSKDVQTLRQLQIGLRFDDMLVETIPYAVLEQSIYEQDGDVYVKPHVLLSYLYALGDKYDTVDTTRTFRTSLGKTISFESHEQDTYHGYDLDEQSLLLSVISCIDAGEPRQIPVAWTSVGRDLHGEVNDFGTTYIEIDLTNQHVWYYENGDCVMDTDVVTGLPTKERETPTGMFYVRGLHKSYTMYYQDGSAQAEYFMEVTPSGVGIHDTNRSDYGGTIYEYAGSHGCINLPAKKAEYLFHRLMDQSTFEIPVLIYK